MNLASIIKKSKKELIGKFTASIMMQGLLLVIPYYWSNCINLISDGNYIKSRRLIIVILLLSILYYIWCYINQKNWYKLYNKIYMEYTDKVTNVNIKNVSLGEYTNIINNDIDIIGSFIGNGITRIIQVIEFIIIYIYFFSVNIYIFIVTIVLSIIMIIVIFYLGSKIEIVNKRRKENLDYKTINIHNIYYVLKQNKKTNRDELIGSTKEYLKSNAKFNIFANAIIYLVLSIIEISRYIIIIYSIYLISNNGIELGTILLVYTYYSKIISNFEVMGTISAEYQSVKVSMNRLNKLINKELLKA